MDVVTLLDRLEETIADGTRIPLTAKVMLDEDALYAILDDIRMSIPDELKQAKLMVRERERLIEEARRDAETIIQDARTQAEKMALESNIVQEANRVANETVAKARQDAGEITSGALRYADDVLESLLGNLDRLQDAVRQNQTEIKTSFDPIPE